MKRHFTLIFATCAFLMVAVAGVVVRVSICTSIIDPYIGRPAA
jgi:hypothetical protein